MRRTRHHRHLWDVVLVVLSSASASLSLNDPVTEDPQFLTYVDQVLLDLVRVHNAFWTEGQWYNMTLRSDSRQFFSLFYDKTSPVQVTTDPTGVYSKQKKRRDLPFIYQSAPPAVPCKNAASTSIISGSKAVDFAAFSIGIMTLVININNNINNNNNNNNNLNLNAVDSSNIVANFNTNNANQVNIMPGAGKRRKRSAVGSAAIMIIAAIKAAMEESMASVKEAAATVKNVPKTHIDLRNDSTVARIQRLVMEKMIKDPKSKIMAGCSDIDNCQQRLSLFI